MAEVTRVPLQPIAKGSLLKLWLGVLAAIALAAGIAWAAMPKGVTVDVITAGDGDFAEVGQVVFVRYTGRLEDGTVFDQTQEGTWPIEGILPDGGPLLLQEGAVIPGFIEGLTQMQKGGTYELFIPADQAYGDEPPPGSPIPANADLIFDIQLVDVMSEEEAQQRFMQMQMQLQQMQGAGGEGAAGAAPPAVAPQ